MTGENLEFSEETRRILRDNFILLDHCPVCKTKFQSFFDLILSAEKSFKKIGGRQIHAGVLTCMKCGRSIGILPEKDVYDFILERNKAYNSLWKSDPEINRDEMKKVLENIKLTGALMDAVVFTIRPSKLGQCSRKYLVSKQELEEGR